MEVSRVDWSSEKMMQAAVATVKERQQLKEITTRCTDTEECNGTACGVYDEKTHKPCKLQRTPFICPTTGCERRQRQSERMLQDNFPPTTTTHISFASGSANLNQGQRGPSALICFPAPRSSFHLAAPDVCLFCPSLSLLCVFARPRGAVESAGSEPASAKRAARRGGLSKVGVTAIYGRATRNRREKDEARLGREGRLRDDTEEFRLGEKMKNMQGSSSSGSRARGCQAGRKREGERE
ncbi:hypothetical protein INR49_005189 [Caranx melampygus]|nr:hypothetical protein INR49_005189 [Caranx melampygus]